MTDLRQAAMLALEALLLPTMKTQQMLIQRDEAIIALRTALAQQQAEPDRRDLQAAGTHPAPCARHCEARAFEIEIRSLNSRLKQQAEPVHGDIRALKYRIHELEGEVMGYKRMLDVAEAASQRKPLTEAQQVDCLVKSGCIETVKMSFESGPYDITRPSINASMLIEAVETAHGIKGGT